MKALLAIVSIMAISWSIVLSHSGGAVWGGWVVPVLGVLGGGVGYFAFRD